MTNQPLPDRPTPLTKQKKAILIGASSGIGSALAHRLASDGYVLALLARRADLLTALTGEINSRAGRTQAIYYPHDVTDYDSIPALLEKILADLGGLDLFVYVAGIQERVGVGEYDFHKDRAMLETNFVGALAWLNPVAALLQNLGTGMIVGFGSVAGDRGRVGAPAYNASKSALHTYLEGLRNRLTRHGVHVLTVKPGYVSTDLNPMNVSRGILGAIPPEKAADLIAWAIRKRRQVVYIPARWGVIMWIIKHIPSFIFRRLSF